MTHKINKRFRGYLPVVIDLETSGFDPQKNAILEIAAVTLQLDDDGLLKPKQTYAEHILPFANAHLDPSAMAFNGIDPFHPFRFAKEESVALTALLKQIRYEVKQAGCQRAVMVAHNAIFDMGFYTAAVARHRLKHNPFHPFTSIDTAALSAVFLGQTVLAKACAAANLSFNKEEAHSAIYDAERTAELFCFLINQWQKRGGWDIINQCPILAD